MQSPGDEPCRKSHSALGQALFSQLLRFRASPSPPQLMTQLKRNLKPVPDRPMQQRKVSVFPTG